MEYTIPFPDQLVELLRRRPPFDAMAAADLSRIVRQLRDVCYPAGTVILGADETPVHLHFVYMGLVDCESPDSGSGSVSVLAKLVTGECFPLEALDNPQATGVTWRARVETCCLEIPLDELYRLKESSPSFAEFCRRRTEGFRFLQTAPDSLQPLVRGDDSQGLNACLRDIMRPDPPTCLPSESIRYALDLMSRSDSTVIIVVDANQAPVGLFTLRDVLHRIAIPQPGLESAMEKVMTPDPVGLGPEVFGHEAALVMARSGFHHIPVVEGGKLAGLVSEQELFQANRTGLSQIRNQIRTAGNIEILRQLTMDVRHLAHNMLEQGVNAEQLTLIISTFNDHIATRIIELQLQESDPGAIDFCWIALGSEGRHEQTLSTDQDNGIIFTVPEGMTAEAVRGRLLPIALEINRALDYCGFPLCKGEVMASNPQWCLSLEEWQRRFAGWLNEPDPHSLLNATIFFDFRPLSGQVALAEELSQWLAAKAPAKHIFLHNLAANALERLPPLGFFRDFVVAKRGEHSGLLDLKTGGITPFVDAARVFALAHGVEAKNTPKRLRQVAEAMYFSSAEVEAWVDAFYFIQMIRLRSQYRLASRNQQGHNWIDPYGLNNLDRKFFLESLRQVKNIQRRVAATFRIGSMGM